MVKPLFKKGDRTRMKNYRPISLLLLEKVMYDRLSHHMLAYCILVPEQFGVRQGKSTDNAAFKLTSGALKSVNQKMHVGGIFSYLAFDYVNHEILLVKLHYYGIQGTVAIGFRSYLTNRNKKQNHLRNIPQNGEQ
jgi:hypothetical protein